MPDRTVNVDGRSIMCAEYGNPAGEVVIYLHGFPGSRLEGALHHQPAARAGVRLIAIDRPGYGGSDPSDATISGIARDVVAVADALDVAGFAVVGVSGGGPYALACAALAPDRVRSVALMAPLGPPDAPKYGMRPANRLLLSLAGRGSPTFAVLQRIAAFVVRLRAERVVKLLSRTLPEIERRMVDDPELCRSFADVLRAAFAQKGAGPTADGPRLANPWGIDLSSIRCPVRIWHGLVDDIVPPGMGGFLEHRVGHDLVVSPLDGHFSLVRNHIGDALSWATHRSTEGSANRRLG